jgi:hypothetical protein
MMTSNMGRSIFGILTALPLLYVLGLLFVFSEFRYETIQVIHYVVMLLYLVLLIAYVRNVLTNDRVPEDKRGLWLALIFLGTSVAQLAYFFSYIWITDSARGQVD